MSMNGAVPCGSLNHKMFTLISLNVAACAHSCAAIRTRYSTSAHLAGVRDYSGVAGAPLTRGMHRSFAALAEVLARLGIVVCEP